MECSLPGSSDHEISQSRTLEWVAISFSNNFLASPNNKKKKPDFKHNDKMKKKRYDTINISELVLINVSELLNVVRQKGNL